MTWHTAKSRVTGSSHEKTNTPCQDAFFVNILGDSLTIAVSDGMGSAQYSDVGSRIATREAVLAMQAEFKRSPAKKYQITFVGSVLAKLFRRPVRAPQADESTYEQKMARAFAIARQRVLEYATEHNHSARDYACTLLLLVVIDNRWYTMHVGDGAIVGYLSPDQTKTLSEPENGEFVNTTTPLTSSTYADQMRFATGSDPLIGVALLTDGIQQLCINQKTRRSYDPFFAYVLRTFRVPRMSKERDALCRDFLNSAPVRDKCDDDLTLVVAWREATSGTVSRMARRV